MFFDDSARNIAAGKAAGFHTVIVSQPCQLVCPLQLSMLADFSTWNGAGRDPSAGGRRGRGAGEHPQHQGGPAGALGRRRRARPGGPPARRRRDHGARMSTGPSRSRPRVHMYPVPCEICWSVV